MSRQPTIYQPMSRRATIYQPTIYQPMSATDSRNPSTVRHGRRVQLPAYALDGRRVPIYQPTA